MNKRGLITLEACMLIILCVAAGLSMFGYLKRAVQGNWKVSTDTFSDEQFDRDRSSLDYNKNEGPAIHFRSTSITSEYGAPGAGPEGSGIMRVSGWGQYE